MKTSRKKGKRGVIVALDDMEIGQNYAVYGLKNGPEQQVQVSRMGFKLMAMNLPFLVGKLASDPNHRPLTFDARFLTFMKVTEGFVKAQRPEDVHV